MASLQSRLSDLITAIGTDIKQLRTWLTGSSSGNLTGLSTTDKTNIVGAINEVFTLAGSGAPDASTTVKGIAELATDAEAITGTDTARTITPANVAAVLTDRIDTNTALGTSNTKVPSQLAVKSYVDSGFASNDAMMYKGVIDASSNPNYPAGSKGDTWKISVAGKIGGASGPNVEVGDLIIGTTDGSSAGNHATVGANWNIVQTNIDGAVTGPASSTSGNLPSFSGTSGKVVADSGFTPSNAAIGGGSATVLPTSAQVVAYAQPVDSDLTAIATLTTTSYGRAFLALADQTALMALIASASETVQGKIELATQAELTTGTDDARAITPLKFATSLGNPDTDLAALYTTAKT